MITDEQRRTRQQYIGSSDAAAICGIDPHRNAADVFLAKRGRLPPSPPTAAMLVGTYCEAGLLQWVEDTLRVPVARDLSYVHRNGVMAANLDGLILAGAPRAIVEAKTAGLLAGRWVDAFGEPDTDQVPDHVLIQATHQLAVLNQEPGCEDIDLVLVPALLVQRGFVLYRLRRNAALVAAVTERCERFWRDYVERDVCPPELPTLENLARREREPGRSVAVPTAVVDGWRQAKASLMEATAAEEAARRVLLAALGDAEEGTCARGRITYRASVRKAYQVAETTVRRLLFSGADADGPQTRRRKAA